MATKRDYYNIDPDYEDVSEEQNKRQRLIEKDAKEETIRKIEHIIRQEISLEIHTREDELNLIDQTVYQARHLLDRLRACLVANYYSSAAQGTLSQDASPSTSASAPFIHPAVKKYLGKRPLTAQESEDDPETETWQESNSNTDKPPPLPNGSNETSQGSKSTTTTTTESPLASQSGVKSVPQSNSNGGRTSRFRIKKKIIVGNASKFIPLDRREDNDPSTHKWLIYVRGPKDEPQIDHFVKKVWFFLHPSYRPNDLVEIMHPPFHLSRRGWGEFPVRVQLHFYDQRNKRVDIIHQLKLDRTYTGLQTLGAETTVEIEIEKENVFDRTASAVCSGNLPCLSVSPLPCAVKNQSLATSKKIEAEEHKTIVETTVHHSPYPIKKEPPCTEAQPSFPPLFSTRATDSTANIRPSKEATGSSPAKNIKTREFSRVSVAENTTPVVISSLTGGNLTGPLTSSYTESIMAVTAITAPPKSTASLPSPIIITAPQKSLASSSGVKIGPSLTSSNVPQAPYFVALSSIANPKLSIPVVMTNAGARPKNPVLVTPSTSTAATLKQGNLQFSTTIPTTKVQTLQGVPLNNLLKTLNSNSKVLWMSPPLMPQVRASKPTGVLPTSSLASSSHLTSSAQSISSILLPPTSSFSPSCSLIATQDKTTSALFSNTIALTNTVSTASSSKCSPSESSTGAKLILAGDSTVKSLPGSSFETRPMISSLDNNYITIQFNTNPADLSQSALCQKKILGAGDKSAPIKEGSSIISPFRVTPQGLVSIPSRMSPSSTSVQVTAAQFCKTNPTSSVPVVHMSTGQQPATSALSSTFKSLGKLPTGTGTAPIILLSGTSVARTSAVITTTTAPIKKVATQQPQGLLIPSSSFSQSVVRPIMSEVKNIPNKTSLLFLSPTGNASNLVKGAATSGSKVVYTTQPPTHNTMNASVSTVHTHVLTSATSSSLAGNPPTSKVCFIQNSPLITDAQKTTVGSSQQLKCSVIGSNPSALTSSKQTYVLTTTKNKGLSLLPSHLVLKPGMEGRPDATQSILYKAAPTDNTPSTQIISAPSAPAGLTLAQTRPMLLLKNQKAPMIVTNQIGLNNTATSITPQQMQILSASKPTQQMSILSTGKEHDNSTMSLQLQYANGHLVLAPPTVRSALGNNVTGGQKIFLKVLPSTTASATIPATNGPKVVNGNSPLNIVSLTTPVTPASSIINTCSQFSTSAKAAPEPTAPQSSRPVKPVENEKRIHGYNKVKKSESAQPATVPLINLSCLPDMISLIRSAVRLHPLVAAKIDRSLHPYAAFTTEQWLSWNIGKRRASEWQRALSVRLYIIRLLKGSSSFEGDKVWTTKQIFCWCRMHAYSPHHLEASSAFQRTKDELLLSSATNSLLLLPLQPLSSFSSMAALEKRLEALEPQTQTQHTQAEIEIDVISTDFPKVRIKREAEPTPSQWPTTHHNVFLPVGDSAVYVQDVARQVGINFQPTEVDDHIHGSVCEMMLFSGVKNLVSDILRTSFALKSKKGKYPTELSLADIHAALSKIPGADFLTNTHLGLVSNPDTHSNDHHKQKHGIT